MSGLDALSRRLAPAEDVERSGGEWWTRRLSGEAPQLRLPRGKGGADWLHAAALTATGALLSGRSVERIFRSPAADMSNKAEERGAAERSAELWRCFLRESEHEDFVAHLDDLVLFAAASMLARRPVELRSWLRSPAGAQAMQPVRASGDWLAHVRASISRAALLLLRQADHRDLQETIRAIDALAAAQREHDAAGIADPRAAAMALGLYHVAHAASRLSEFLLAGSVLTRGRRVDVGPELLRLLSKAEEFFRLSGSPELHIWLRAITALFTHQRSDSIWVSAGGMGTTVDLLLRRLAQEGREQPIFTLLPSQREALQSRLLDPAQVAVVLQMPTSAGKTLLAEFAIAQVVGTYGRGARIAYVAPTRALCTQIQSSLRADLAALGIPVSAAGGAFEEDPYELNLLQETDGVVVSTPEKLDLLLRAHPDWAAGLRLVVIDEAHTLNDRERGARLELLLANLRREQSQARLLLLTPFIENAAQIAEWLGEGRSTPITVHWRPSRLLLGVPTVEGRGRIRRVDIDWLEPHRDGPVPAPLTWRSRARAPPPPASGWFTSPDA